MNHFTNDNTEGYSKKQLDRANKIIHSMYEPANLLGGIDGDNDQYKRDCELILQSVETI